ncbi:hypothetical protein AYO20_09687 [Fonsecaea nubica]|uniref:CHK kinase-like domain-containing protein n=1 Tax=Fonsecaea nubica TaxID=856822 RepID=A0A178CEQ9_9EURO|nr:hypothetical protein AYO20_09687 [Fonsecaea nubica]OAL27834.1 hypothetical protein AYO20_09687 [Fonsecaea nubica]
MGSIRAGGRQCPAELECQTPLPATVDEITLEWIQDKLNPHIKSCTPRDTIVGTATKVILDLEYDDDIEHTDHLPASICVKGGFTADLHSWGTRKAYVREADFFARLAHELDMILPEAYFAATNTTQGQGIVVLQDLAANKCVFGEVTEPYTVTQVKSGLEQLARLHGTTWALKSPETAWLETADVLRDVMKVLLTDRVWYGYLTGENALPEFPEHMKDLQRMKRAFQALWDLSGPQCAIHGDPHVGNTFKTPRGDVAFLDFQNVQMGASMHDVAYFLTGSLDIEERRQSERRLLASYLKALHSAGGPCLTIDDVWDDYRCHQLHGFLWAFTPPEMQTRERVRAVSLRHFAAVADHSTLELLESKR